MPESERRKASTSLLSIVPPLPYFVDVPMGLRGLQILVIEDAPDLLGVLTMLLRIGAPTSPQPVADKKR